MEAEQPLMKTPSATTPSLLDLPPEIQVQIYKVYYPSWSLTVHNLSNIDSILSSPRVCTQQHLSCPQADFNTLFNSNSQTPSSVPSINLILTCRSIHATAHPFFASSLRNRNTLELSMANSWLANKALRTTFMMRFRQLLTDINILKIDVSNMNPFYFRRGGIQDLNLALSLPNLNHIILQDTFKCTNTRPLLEKYQVENWATANMNNSDEALVSLITKVVEKRLDVMMSLQVATRVVQEYRKTCESREEARREISKWRISYAFRCRIQGVEGTYEGLVQIPALPQFAVDRLPESCVNKEWWENEVEEADFQAPDFDEDQCEMM